MTDHRRRFPGFDDKIVALYARGMITRDIQGHVRKQYGIEISPNLVPAVIDEVTAWASLAAGIQLRDRVFRGVVDENL